MTKTERDRLILDFVTRGTCYSCGHTATRFPKPLVCSALNFNEAQEARVNAYLQDAGCNKPDGDMSGWPLHMEPVCPEWVRR